MELYKNSILKNMKKHNSPKEIGQLLGVTVQTLQNGDDAGR
jgi:hypothetical protein